MIYLFIFGISQPSTSRGIKVTRQEVVVID